MKVEVIVDSEDDQFSPERVADRLEIEHRIYQYCRAVDRRDLESARSAFHPDAIDSHGSFRGGIDGLLNWLNERHAQMHFSFHEIGNIFIEFAGRDEAFVESYFFCWQSYEPNGADGSRGGERQLAGRYIDHFQRRNGRWRIYRRDSFVEAAAIVTQAGVREVGGAYSGFALPRDERDPSRVLRKQMGLE